MSDLSSLLAAIISNPDEDTPRLMYADELEQQEIVYRKCSVCRGTGRLSWWTTCGICDGNKQILDTTNQDLANYIRLSIEFSNHKKSMSPRKDDKVTSVLIRDDGYRPAMRGSEYYNRGMELKKQLEDKWKLTCKHHMYQGPSIQYSIDRGFISSITCTATQFLSICDKLIWHESMEDSTIRVIPPLYGSDIVYKNDYNKRPCPLTAHPVREIVITNIGIPTYVNYKIVKWEEELAPKYGIKFIIGDEYL